MDVVQGLLVTFGLVTAGVVLLALCVRIFSARS